VLRPHEDMRVLVESSGFDTTLYIQRDISGACGQQENIFCNNNGGQELGSRILTDLRGGETYHLFIVGAESDDVGRALVDITRDL